jgi:maltose O-acetyltransferase
VDYFRDTLRKVYYRIFRVDPIKEWVKKGLVIGKNFHMFEGVIIDPSHIWHIEIGDDVTLAPHVLIFAHDASTKKHIDYTRIGKVKIGNRVFIGAGSIVLPGVTIGDDVVIGAGSVVTRDVPNGRVAVGIPARVVSTINGFVQRKYKEMEECPCFGEEYTLTKGVNTSMKKEMNTRMKKKIGYVI